MSCYYFKQDIKLNKSTKLENCHKLMHNFWTPFMRSTEPKHSKVWNHFQKWCWLSENKLLAIRRYLIILGFRESLAIKKML